MKNVRQSIQKKSTACLMHSSKIQFHNRLSKKKPSTQPLLIVWNEIHTCTPNYRTSAHQTTPYTLYHWSTFWYSLLKMHFGCNSFKCLKFVMFNKPSHYMVWLEFELYIVVIGGFGRKISMKLAGTLASIYLVPIDRWSWTMIRYWCFSSSSLWTFVVFPTQFDHIPSLCAHMMT